MRSKIFLLVLIAGLLPRAVFSQSADFSADDSQVCPGVYVSYTDLSTFTPGATVHYTWNFPGGFPNTDTTANPTVFYATPGTYAVSLTLCEDGGGCDTESKPAYITVHNNPEAFFNWNIPDLCDGLTADFTDGTNIGDAPITSWLWDFADGGWSVDQNPTHSFTSAGSFGVILFVTDGNGCEDDTTIQVNTSALLDVSLSIDSTYSCQGPLTSNISASASGGASPYTYSWDFGNGTTGNTASNSVVFTDCGFYDINLTVTDANGCSINKVFTDAVEVFCPAVDFTFSADTVCSEESVHFDDASTPGMISQTWQFDPASPWATSTGGHPDYTYHAQGTYTVTHCVKYAGGCEICTVKTITVLDKPLITDFGIVDSMTCTIPFSTVMYPMGVTGTGPYTYEWIVEGQPSIFGDTVGITLTDPGTYDVSLVVGDAAGCTDTLTKIKAIRIRAAKSLFEANPPGGCAPADIEFSNLSYSPLAPIDSFLWDMGDGTVFSTTVADTFFHTYTATGDYTVSLIVYTALGCSDTSTMLIEIGDVLANFQALDGIDTTCGGITIENLAINSEYTIMYWGNGDSTVLSDPLGNASYFYGVTDSTHVNIDMVASYNGCVSTWTIPALILPPHGWDHGVSFDCATPSVGTLFLDTAFTEGSFCWVIGPDTICDVTPLVYDFGGPGIYEVEILDEDNQLFDSLCYETIFDVAVVDVSPVFNSDTTQGCDLLSVNFYNSNPAPVLDSIEYVWTVGPSLIGGITGGDTVSTDYWTHTFDQPDIYPVEVSALDSNICNVSWLDTIVVSNVTAAFNIDSMLGCVPATVYFSDASFTADSSETYFQIVKWDWSFGNPSCPDYSGENPPPCTYAAGTYTVFLRVTDNYGCQDVYSQTFTIDSGDVKAIFAVEDQICGQDSMFFLNGSTGSVASWFWEFGDGTTSTDVEPSHIYAAAGHYNVRLTVTDSSGCSDQRVKTISYEKAELNPGFVMNYLTPATCPPIPVELVDTTHGTINSVQWIVETTLGTATYTGSSVLHTFNSGGLFDVTMIVENSLGCFDTLALTDYVHVSGPSGTMSVTPSTGCAPFLAFFDLEDLDATQVFIDFGDGDTLEVFGDTYYTYETPGTYCPQLILLDSTGCQTVMNCPGMITVNGGPLPALGVSDSAMCDGEQLWIYDESTYPATVPVISFLIDFGDGTDTLLSGAFDSIPYNYTAPGTYYLSAYMATAAGCEDSFALDMRVDPIPSGNYSLSANLGCAPLDAHMGLTGVVADSILVDFGDGTYGPVSGSTDHLYSTPGVYYPSVSLRDVTGCAADLNTGDSVVVAYSPEAKFTALDSSFCVGDSLIIINQTVDTVSNPLINAVDGYTLLQDDIAFWMGTDPDGMALVLNNAGTTEFKLVAFNDYGCADTVSLSVDVLTPPIAAVGDDMIACQGATVTLNGLGSSPDAMLSWSPGIGLSDPNVADPEATVTYDITYYLVADNGVCSTVDSVFISVLDELDVSGGPDHDICIGQSAELSGAVSTAITGLDYSWSPSTYLDDASSLNPISTPSSNITYRLEATCGTLYDSTQINVRVHEYPSVDISVDSGTIAISGSPVTLDALGFGGGGMLDYWWDEDPALSCTQCQTTQAMPLADQWFTVNVTNEYGCASTDSVYLRVLSDCVGETLDIGKAFTPNNDGLNDYFTFRSETIQLLESVQVFNRWGEMVYESAQASPGWDGTFRGKVLNPGVFVYQIRGVCSNGEVFNRVGNITLIK